MKIINRRARYDYSLFERYEAGIALTGAEVKALRAKRANLTSAFIKFIGNELYLINATIQAEGVLDYKPTRTRKLLIHKSELISIASKMKQKRLTVVPLAVYTKGPLFKVEFALAKGKREFEKRAKIKQADIERELERELREK